MFNPANPTVMHVDINSCFATIEQQANPRLRGIPTVVAAYTTPRGCILAASREAKALGIQTGMRVFEGQRICPKLRVLPSDPPKYRFINKQLVFLLSQYSPDVEVKSIDEMVLRVIPARAGICVIAQEIKKRIKEEIGEWITVSIGISTNRYLAKVASNLHKPDGLDTIAAHNIEHILCSLKLTDLSGIKEGMSARLRMHGIFTPLAFYYASGKTLKSAFSSKIGYDWWHMLHGYESDLYDRTAVKTIGHSFALPTPYGTRDPRLHQILCQLVEKMGRRLRQNGFSAQGIHVSCGYWHHGEKISRQLFTNRDLYQEALRILAKAPDQPVRLLAVTSFALTKEKQMNFLEKSDALTHALDAIADRWGERAVFPARMLGMKHSVLDRIAFGGARGVQ